MDLQIIATLEQSGFDVHLEETVLTVPIQLTRDETKVVPLGEEFMVFSRERLEPIRPKLITELFAGNAEPPDFSAGSTPEYVMFFALIEMTAADFCSVIERPEKDVEFERLYSLLRRRPDGRDGNPLFSYMQAAARVYMSLKDVSRMEFEAVARRLARSARTFSRGPPAPTTIESSAGPCSDGDLIRSDVQVRRPRSPAAEPQPMERSHPHGRRPRRARSGRRGWGDFWWRRRCCWWGMCW